MVGAMRCLIASHNTAHSPFRMASTVFIPVYLTKSFDKTTMSAHVESLPGGNQPNTCLLYTSSL